MRIARSARFRVVLIAFLLLSAAATAFADTVRVTMGSALVWTQPEGVSFVVTQLPRDTVVEVLRRVGDWYQIVLPASVSTARTGFIRVTQVAFESSAPLSPEARRLLAAAPRPPRKSSVILTIDAVRRWDSEDMTRSSVAFSDTYAEDGTITATYGGNGGWAFDVLAGQTFRGPIGAGLGVSYYRRERPATVDAQVPHPFFFNQPRSATFETLPLEGQEVALHIPFFWMPQTQSPLRVMAFGGLSVFWASQQVVTDLVIDDPYPNDTVTIKRAITEERKGTNVGFHAGADVSYFFSRTVGLGVGARYTHATFGFDDDPDAKSTGVTGAAQVAAGLRFRF